MVTQLVLMCFGCEAAPSPAHYFFLSCPLFPLLIHVARRYNLFTSLASVPQPTHSHEHPVLAQWAPAVAQTVPLA